MNTRLHPFALVLAAVLLWGLPQSASASASHFRFASLSWKRAPGTNTLAVEITVTEAWRISSGGIGGRVVRLPVGVTGYELQTATAISSLWTPVLAPVAQENGDSLVRLPAEGTRFYRLVPAAPPRPGDYTSQ